MHSECQGGNDLGPKGVIRGRLDRKVALLCILSVKAAVRTPPRAAWIVIIGKRLIFALGIAEKDTGFKFKPLVTGALSNMVNLRHWKRNPMTVCGGISRAA